jgi:hypothetical protein
MLLATTPLRSPGSPARRTTVINVLNSPIPDVGNAVTVDWFRSSPHRKTISPWCSGVVL